MSWKSVAGIITGLSFAGGLIFGTVTLYAQLATASEVVKVEKRIEKSVSKVKTERTYEADVIHQKIYEKLDSLEKRTSSSIIDISIEQKLSALQKIKLKERLGQTIDGYELQRREQLIRHLDRLYKKQDKLDESFKD
jgi:hypothetical protein